MSSLSVHFPTRRSFFLVLLMLLTAVIAMASLMAPLLVHLITPSLEVGQVASQDVLAPQAITYQSEVLTDQRRNSAVLAVAPVYTSPDTSIARQQLEHLRTSLDYISSVRADTFASARQKLDDLAALEDVHLSQDTATNILNLNDSRWQVVQQEAYVTLEQVMRTTIRSDRLEDARNNVPSMVSLLLPEKQAAIVAELAAAYVTPNSLYSESLTEAARQRARESVTPINRTFMAGETVVQRGQVLSAADVEALKHLGLAQPRIKWQDMVSAGALVLLMVAFIVFYLRRNPALTRDLRSLTLMAILCLVFLFGTRLTITGHTIIPYAIPLAAYSLVIAALFGSELALVTSLPLAILVAYGLSNSLDLTLYFIVGSLFGVLTLGRARRTTSFFWAGVAIAVSGAAVVLIYHLPLPTMDWIGLTTLAGAAIFNGLAAASLTILLQFFLAQFLGVATPMQLVELTRPDHPLLKMLLRDAPGTYQHGLQVANLAEQAAERIGADTLLTRVGALYHDAGKALNPIFFIENQVPGFLNPHEDLDPVSSAATIIRHVPDGLELARKYRIPRRLLDFISEHHGTMITRYQYAQAVAVAGGDESRVEKDLFRYPGPRPQSRETAILMLADGCEAQVRAERPKDEDALSILIKGVIDNRVACGQLDDTTLTLRDLDVIRQSFTATLRGIYHPRVQYPQLETSPSEEATVPVSLPSMPRHSMDAPISSPVDSTSTTS